MTVRPLDHTADLGFDLEASSLAALYEEAGRALSDTISVASALESDRNVEIVVEAADREAAMVEWLEELLFRFDTDGFLGRSFRIEVIETDGVVRLRASVGGTVLDPRRHPVKTAVKAATWHGLRVAPTAEGWSARVILDV